MLKKFFYLVFILVFYLVFGTFVTNSHRHLLPVTCLAGFILAYILAGQSSYRGSFTKILIKYYVPFLILFFIGSIVENDFSRSLLYFFFLPLSAFLGHQFQKKRHYGYVLLFLLAAPFAGYILLPNTFSYIKNREARNLLPFPEMSFENKKKEAITFEKNKTVVLDFWTTSCGICFEQFPDFEAVYRKYRSNDHILFYSVNVPLPRDSLAKTYALVDTLHYEFPTIYTTSIKEVREKLGITGYPQLIILRNDTLYYKGSAYYEPYMWVHHIEREIKRVLP